MTFRRILAAGAAIGLAAAIPVGFAAILLRLVLRGGRGAVLPRIRWIASDR